MSYDVRQLSPRPWGERLFYLLLAEAMEKPNPTEAHAFAFALHCVNHHEELVAFVDSVEILCTASDDSEKAEMANKARALLAKVKS